MRLILQKPDAFGAIASALCLAHCLITPLIFIAHLTTACCATDVPFWWHSVDYIFLIISFVAVYRSTKTTTKAFMKYLLWLSYALLFVSILNEKLNLFPIPEYLNYTPALALVALHIYNLNFCQCKNNTCCTNNG